MSLVIVSDCCVNLEGERIGLVIGREVKRPWRKKGFCPSLTRRLGALSIFSRKVILRSVGNLEARDRGFKFLRIILK